MLRMHIVRSAYTPDRFLKALSPQTCRSYNQPSSSWSSTSRPRRRLALMCRPSCSRSPTRSLNEASRVHHAARRRGSVAACGTRAADGPDAADRSADGLAGERSGSPVGARSVCPGAAETGLGGRPQFADRYSLGEPRRSGVDASIRKELVALQPELILSQSTPATAALLQETRTIPVIFGI